MRHALHVLGHVCCAVQWLSALYFVRHFSHIQFNFASVLTGSVEAVCEHISLVAQVLLGDAVEGLWVDMAAVAAGIYSVKVGAFFDVRDDREYANKKAPVAQQRNSIA